MSLWEGRAVRAARREEGGLEGKEGGREGGSMSVKGK